METIYAEEQNAARDRTAWAEQIERELTQRIAEESKAYGVIKRVGDIVLSLGGLLFLLPLFAALCVVIYLDDPHGSPIYSQIRIGKDGKPFRFYKFRSMVVNADQLRGSLEAYNEKDGPVFKMKQDPRITRVGRVIRRTSLDELPQLWNVLRGEMSMVGPRPPLPDEVAQYDAYHKLRLLVKPGLTCFWQVKKTRDQVGFSKWMDMDIEYIRKRSLLVDIKLIFLTFGAVFRGQGE
ncbi:MAG: sugar transferase [Eubacteriales bacterium]|nr:sugar transferase [Eubacteriales bacterium]